MEINNDSTKEDQLNIHIIKEVNNKNKPKIKSLALLYSSNSNVDINYKKMNIIHLSRLFKKILLTIIIII